jgi:hypothetical protein
MDRLSIMTTIFLTKSIMIAIDTLIRELKKSHQNIFHAELIKDEISNKVINLTKITNS